MSMHEIDLARLDLNLLVVFEALLYERHVGRAAARLHLSQSATSHALGRLRTLLDDPLFVRHPRGVEPTERAGALAEPLAAALEAVRGVLRPEAPFEPARLRRTFTVGATDYAVLVVLAPLLERLGVEAPGLDLSIRPVDRASLPAAFDAGTLDFAIGNFPDVPARLHAQALFDERFVGIVRRDHPALRRGAMSLDDFVGTPHALVSLRGDPHGSVDDALAALGRTRRVALTTPHFLTLPFLVGASELVGVAPERTVVRLAASAALARFELPLELSRWSVHLVTGRQLEGRPELAWFGALLRETTEREASRPVRAGGVRLPGRARSSGARRASPTP